MKAVLINPKDRSEFKFVTTLLEKLGIDTALINQKELEDLAMSELMKKSEKGKKATKAEVRRKHRS
jgi:hypothetical protein